MYGRKLVSDPFNFADSKPDKDVKKLKNKSMIKAYPPHKAIWSAGEIAQWILNKSSTNNIGGLHVMLPFHFSWKKSWNVQS